ncbi:MAG: ATP-binding cassette domain-containing protein [Chitinophagaceae bacterium]|nr:MAG: ATP-binding cassette domain-containing protein [Chitinophagaceae bacterium]
MTISLENTGKRYNYEWIFRKINFTFEKGNRYAVLGPNGSGKSTLLQIIAGSLAASEGKINYSISGNILNSDYIFRYLSLSAPYLELIEEYTFAELLGFQRYFKPFLNNLQAESIAKIVQLENALHKQIRFFSSGMKQRAKLAQAIFADAPLLLLDEPCTNLDEAGCQLYQELITQYTTNKLVIISSNDPQEYEACNRYLHITDYK